MEITKALEELRERIERPRQFFGLTFGLNKEECAVLIRRIYALLPEQVKEAAVITRESERIVGSAKEDATLTLERAKAESERRLEEAKKEAEAILEKAAAEREKLVADSEILKLAKAEAEELRAQAEAEAARLKRGADEYAMDVLYQLEGVVSKVMSTIERGKSEMERHPQQPAGQKPIGPGEEGSGRLRT